MNRADRRKTPLRDLATYGTTRAVRWDRCDYRGDEVIHAILRADDGHPFRESALAKLVCENVEFYCRKLGFRLFGYCLMPNHLHTLLSPNSSGFALSDWLRSFKSYTTNQGRKLGHGPRLWQRSAYDHVCKNGETAESVLTYIVENPIRKGLVTDWHAWPWTKIFIKL